VHWTGYGEKFQRQFLCDITKIRRNQNLGEFANYIVCTKLRKTNYGSVNRRLSQITVLRAYPNNPLYPQGKPDACVVGEKTFSTWRKPRLASIFGLPPWA